MVAACNSGGSISKGPSEGLRMLEKESTGDAGEVLGRGDQVKSNKIRLQRTADWSGSVQTFFNISVVV